MQLLGRFVATVLGESVVGYILLGNPALVPEDWRGPAFIVVALAVIVSGTAAFVVWVWRDRPAEMHRQKVDMYRRGSLKLLRRYYLEVHRDRRTGMPKGLSAEQIEHKPIPKAWADTIYEDIGLPPEDDYL